MNESWFIDAGVNAQESINEEGPCLSLHSKDALIGCTAVRQVWRQLLCFEEREDAFF